MSDTKQIIEETNTSQEVIDEKRRINCEDIAKQYLEPIYKDHNIDISRDTAAEKIFRLLTNILIDQAREHANTEYYRGIVVKIGELFGAPAYISDDGSVQEDVLCAKVFDLVKELQDKKFELDEMLNQIYRNAKSLKIVDAKEAVAGIPDSLSLGIEAEEKDESTTFINEALMKQVAKLQKENNELKKTMNAPDVKALQIFTMLTQGLSFQHDLMRYAGNPNNFDVVFVILNSVLRKYDAIKAVVNEQNNPSPYFNGGDVLKPPYVATSSVFTPISRSRS